jgi:hypothetical protein
MNNRETDPGNSNRNPQQRREWAFRTFWSVGSGLSFALNIILLAIVITLLGQLHVIRTITQEEIVAGLYGNFVLMDQATIKTTVVVEDNIAVQFNLPLQEDTVVVLTEDTAIEDATVSMNTGGLNIVTAPTDIVLPKGTRLPVRLDLQVPVNTEIPISLTVPVSIPLNETELHKPLVGLQEVVEPLYQLLDSPASTWSKAPCLYWGLNCP